VNLLLASSDVISHLVDQEILGRWFTAHHVLLLITAVVMVVGLKWVALRVQSGAPTRGFLALVELGCVWVRDEIVYPWLGEKEGRKLLFFFWTLFYFILVSNVIGLLPQPLNLFGKTATGNIAVTAGLAFITFCLVQVRGMIKHGWAKYWLHLVPHGVPVFLAPLVWVIEFVGLLTKPFALTVRLFANMTAGHAILAVLFGFFIGVAPYPNLVVGGVSTVATIAFVLFIMLFETLVALIQAYIFTVLTAIFVSLAVAEEH
jgi:F-type H+-transporting ATPase subunit a